jgi:hypothetical protein
MTGTRFRFRSFTLLLVLIVFLRCYQVYVAISIISTAACRLCACCRRTSKYADVSSSIQLSPHYSTSLLSFVARALPLRASPQGDPKTSATRRRCSRDHLDTGKPIASIYVKAHASPAGQRLAALGCKTGNRTACWMRRPELAESFKREVDAGFTLTSSPLCLPLKTKLQWLCQKIYE